MINKYSEIIKAPHQISFDITNKCNLRCLHCFNNSGENDVINDELTDEEVMEFITSITPLQLYNICFCGGEPLLRKELLYKCIKKLKESGTHCSMVTNAILVQKEVLYELEKCGLDAIQFSLDGLRTSHDRLRNKEGVFKQVIQAIEIVLEETNIHLSIAFTPTAFNVDDFEEICELLINRFERSHRKQSNDYIELRLQPLMLLGRARKHHDIEPSDLQYRKLVQMIEERKTIKYSKCLDIKWGDPIDHLLRFREPNNFMDQSIIHANGDIVVSAYIPLVVGNIRKHSLVEYWEHGLNKVWTKNVVQYLVSQMQSISDMEKVTLTVADINTNECLYLDIMENDLDDLNLIKEVILKNC